jgi:predicted flap endonuclease-1-like 5' DNA nuclease
MPALVLETFGLMVIAVAVGMAIGILARQVVAGRGARPAAVVADDRRAPAADAYPGPGSDEPARPDPAADASGSAAEPDLAPVTLSDVVVDPDRAAGADQVGVRPPALSGPRDGRADDLKVIRGIGPQNEARLQALGVFHLDQIAAWSPEEARWVGTYLAFPGRIEREDWVGQATALTAASEA